MKRALKIIIKTLLAIVLLFVALVASLYLPPVQRWAVGKLTAYIEEQTGLDVSIGSVHIVFPLDISLGQVRVAQPPSDVIEVESTLIDLDLTRLLSMHIGVEAIELSNGSISTTELIESLSMKGSLGSLRVVADDIDLRGKKVNVTDAALDGCVLDIMLRETAEEDTTQTAPAEWQIDIDKFKIQNSKFKIGDERQSFKVVAAIREASLDGGNISLAGGMYRVGKISLSADSLSYDIPGAESVAGLDVNHLAFRDAELELDKLSYNFHSHLLLLTSHL